MEHLDLAQKMGFFGPLGEGVVEVQSHLFMPPVSSSVHAHARSCAYVCTRACTSGVHTLAPSLPGLVVLCWCWVAPSPGLVHVCTEVFCVFPGGNTWWAEGPQQD